jgi:hypothetical protein
VAQLAAASQLAERLRVRGDELLDQFVDAARAGGASWSEIGCGSAPANRPHSNGSPR